MHPHMPPLLIVKELPRNIFQARNVWQQKFAIPPSHKRHAKCEQAMRFASRNYVPMLWFRLRLNSKNTILTFQHCHPRCVGAKIVEQTKSTQLRKRERCGTRRRSQIAWARFRRQKNWNKQVCFLRIFTPVVSPTMLFGLSCYWYNFTYANLTSVNGGWVRYEFMMPKACETSWSRRTNTYCRPQKFFSMQDWTNRLFRLQFRLPNPIARLPESCSVGQVRIVLGRRLPNFGPY